MHDLKVDNLELDFIPRPGQDPPMTPLVFSLDAKVTNSGLTKAVKMVLGMVGDKAPVDIEFDEAHFVEGGAEITVTAGVNRFLKASATAVIGITAHNDDSIAVSVVDIKALGKLPVEGFVTPAIEKGLAKAAAMPGITRDPNNAQGLLIKPNILLQAQGIPLEFKEPGTWSVVYGPNSMTARFSAS